MLGSIPLGAENLFNLDEVVYEYNPRGLHPLTEGMKGSFSSASVQIDHRIYSVDLGALPSGSFEDDPDFTFDELMSS
jgi:hypothetical protein